MEIPIIERLDEVNKELIQLMKDIKQQAKKEEQNRIIKLIEDYTFKQPVAVTNDNKVIGLIDLIKERRK